MKRSIPRALVSILLPLLFLAPGAARAADANRLTYLDENDPYYVSRGFPKLTTPQWVGEPGVDAVVILAIDDLRDPAKYEKFLRPALDRLKKIDGRAPVSIMTCKVDPADPRLKKFLAEGLSLEAHTIDHPCPILSGGDFAAARKTFDDCVDLLDSIPGNRAVAFRTPCCDSKNTLSPRLLAEIFNGTSSRGNFLAADSSVFNRFTADDPELPRELVLDEHAVDRYARYVPFPSFANSVRDYPYPYVIGKLCWEFPCVTPSDWQSHNIQGDGNPRLIADWEAQLDATVLKQGTFTLVFHPYGWSTPAQIAQFVDEVDRKYGKRVKFLTFRESVERMNKNMLGGQPLRAPTGEDNGVRLLDLNNDGYLDVVIGNAKVRQTRLWDPNAKKWNALDFPAKIVSGDTVGHHFDNGVRFGVLRPDGAASMLLSNETARGAWTFTAGRWVEDSQLRSALDLDGGLLAARDGVDQGVRLRDINRRGRCELLVSNPSQNAAYHWEAAKRAWARLPFALPEGARIVDGEGRDAGLRFVDLDEDGVEDVLFSNEKQFAVCLWSSMQEGWSRKIAAARRTPGDAAQIPPIVRRGTSNGAWFMRRTMWVQNEDTATLPDVVERKSFSELLGKSDPPPLATGAALKSMQARPGFQVELAAAEPLTEDPIAFAWGADRRLWVVEMGDYPLGIDGKGTPGGKVRVLEDTNGDGHYVKSTVFLDHLRFPTGIMPWGKGVLIVAAPEIIYAEDSKHDGHCDIRKTLYSGFTEGNQQHRANGLLWGLDNWIHGANGHSGGSIRSFNTDKGVSVNGRDFRLRPHEGVIEPETGISQYGHTVTDWGDWFGCDNTNPMYQFVLEDRYLRRNPYLTPPDPRVQTSDTPGAAAVYPISRTLPRFNDPWGANHFTSANSAIVYRDDLFGPAFAGNSFVSEPVHNLVHREVMRREGLLYHSRRAEDETDSEFFASSDNWSRPTMLRVGPDGALWVADMYRFVIEHPEWIPKDWQARLDLRAGHDRGRIYRIYPVGVKPRMIPKLDALSGEQLVAALDSPSGWQRDFAQQMLVQRKEAAAAPSLEKLARESKNPLARLHALCTLDGLNALPGKLLVSALKDAEAGIRRHAARLCEGRFDLSPEIGDRLLALVNDPDPQVRLQVAYTLGEWNDPRAADALAAMALHNSEDRYITTAVLSSISRRNLDRVVKGIAASDDARAKDPLALTLLKFSIAMGEAKATASLIVAFAPAAKGPSAAEAFSATEQLLDALDANNVQLSTLVGSNDPELSAAAQRILAALDAARAAAGEAQRPEIDRAAAIRLLGRQAEHLNDDLQTLARFLSPQTSQTVQQAAVAALGRARSHEAATALLSKWKTLGPARRTQVLDALLARPQTVAWLLDAMENRQMLASEIDAPHRQRILQVRDNALRARARKLLAETIKPDRQQVIEAFKSALTLAGDASRGAALFGKTCSTCHRLSGLGNAVGPDLAGIGDKSAEGLLIAILDPNRAVEPLYVNYVADTNDGQTISGILRRESGNSITFALAGGTEQTILRSDLKSFRSTGLSLMPEGLETGLAPQDLADVIAFVQSAGAKPSRRTVDGNEPRLVMPTADGKLQLLPDSAQIFGSQIVLERQYGNLGQWTNEADYALWQMQPARAGTYEVYIHYACDNASAGNTLLLQCGTERVAVKVEGTGNWDTYRRIKAGEIKLGAGRQQLTTRPQAPLRGALIDLRAVELWPVRQ